MQKILFPLKWLLHRLAHRLSMNEGQLVSYQEDGKHMIAFKCDGCGKLDGAHEAGRYGYDA